MADGFPGSAAIAAADDEDFLGVVETTNFIYVLELKLSNNGGVDAAEEQMKAKQYAEPFKADKRKVIALAIELDDMGKGLVDWKEV